MRDLLRKFEEKDPEIVFEWNDSETEARGWVVINSLRGGAAGGGTRMRKGLDRREVESLAKTMEVKFSVSGPPIGGAKSGIDFDPSDPRKHGVLERWYKAVIPLLKAYYGTGGDMNVDEIHEVIPITEDFGLWHPQEGVVNGHFQPRENEKIQQIGQLRFGVSKVVEDAKFSPEPSRKYVIADLITGYGVAQSILKYYELSDKPTAGKKVIVQGWGNVGSAAAYYLSQSGLKIVGIIDKAGGIIEPDGLSFADVKSLFLNKDGNKLVADNMLSFDDVNARVWDMEAEIFLPCAGSRLISQDQVDRMISNGLEVISSGANVPFADKEIFFGPIMEYTDQKVSIIPDFIANCGMARVFAYCMEKDNEMSDEAIFHDTSQIIDDAIKAIIEKHHSTKNMAATGFEIALSQLILNMEVAIIIVFVLGYLAIALEHPIHIDKAASALILGVGCWALFVLGVDSPPELLTHDYDLFVDENPMLRGGEILPMFLEHRLLHHLSEIASILFFLMGAMTIVETVDAHEGFRVITDKIKTTNKVKLLWILSILTFFFSAVLDNLTTTIVMVSLLRKLIDDKKTRWFFVGFLVIAANAGGAWSPIGDVTTTMLWIKKQLPDVPIIIKELFIPSLATVLIPLGILSFTLKGNVTRPNRSSAHDDNPASDKERMIIFILGVAGLLFVPVFKTVTHLPPFMGMMLSLGVIWLVTEIMHRKKSFEAKKQLNVLYVLRKIDSASVLFFLGILLGVSALQEVGILSGVAAWLDKSVGNIYAIDITIGLLSAIVDNVPLVAAAQGMYPIAAEGAFAMNGTFWLFLAYCAGTGGSALIIGSAAGVAAMGLERIDFIWYLKKMTWLAIIGYFAGAAVFILMSA